MFRVAASPRGEVAAELGSQLPGRGAHCCFERSCLRQAMKPGLLAHVLRRAVQVPDEESLAAQIRAALENRIRGLLAAGIGKGTITTGREAALREGASGKAGRWFLASDLSPNSRREMEEKAMNPVPLPLGMEDVGRASGRKPTGVLFVADPPLEEALALSVSQWNSLNII